MKAKMCIRLGFVIAFLCLISFPRTAVGSENDKPLFIGNEGNLISEKEMLVQEFTVDLEGSSKRVNFESDELSIDGIRRISHFSLEVPDNFIVKRFEKNVYIEKVLSDDETYVIYPSIKDLNNLTGPNYDQVGNEDEVYENFAGFKWKIVKIYFRDGHYDWYMNTENDSIPYELHIIFPSSNREEYIELTRNILKSFEIGVFTKPATSILPLSNFDTSKNSKWDTLFEWLIIVFGTMIGVVGVIKLGPWLLKKVVLLIKKLAYYLGEVTQEFNKGLKNKKNGS